MNTLVRVLLMFVVAVSFVFAPSSSASVKAQEETIGYFWSLTFDFESTFNGVLEIEVGPWQNGGLVSVVETSQTRVVCRPVGDVRLIGGDAVFANGGYLSCEMDIHAALEENHADIDINFDEEYVALFAEATVYHDLTGARLLSAPIFSHPDVVYAADFASPDPTTVAYALAMHSRVNDTTVGWQTVGITPGQYYAYEFIYDSALGEAFFAAGGQTSGPIPAGTEPVVFATEATTFTIGSNGSDTLTGRIGHLIVDPGNSAH